MTTYITFDSYYTHTQYNDFIDNLKHNNIIFKEYVCIKSPYQFYIGIDEKYLPVFLKYKIASSTTIQYLLEKIVPFQSSDIYTLTRKTNDNAMSYEKFISPTIFKNIKLHDYACVFRYRNVEELMKITKELGITIWVLGKQRVWNLAFTYSKYIKNYIPLNYLLVEKNRSGDYDTPGYFEHQLNYKKLITTKLTNKYIDYPCYDNGKYLPLKKVN